MRILIKDIMDNFICFSSQFGEGIGIWEGFPPQKNEGYYVEFDTSQKMIIDDIVVTTSNKCSIEVVDNKNIMTMQLMDYDDLGCASFYIDGMYFLIETEYNPLFLQMKGFFLSLTVSDLHIYPYD